MIYEALKSDYKKFLVEKNSNLKDCVQLVLADIKQYSVDNRKEITDDVCISILNKNIKQTEETLSFVRDKEDKVCIYEKRIKYLKQYLPTMLDEEEVEKIVYSTLENITPLNKGIAMKTVMPILTRRADGKLISKVVDRFLSLNQ